MLYETLICLIRAFQTDGDYLCCAFVGWDWHVFKMFLVLEIIALIILKHSFPSILSRNNITILQTLFETTLLFVIFVHLHSTGWTKASIDMECNLDFLDPRFGLKLRGVLSQNYLDNSQPCIFSSFSSITSHGGKKKRRIISWKKNNWIQVLRETLCCFKGDSHSCMVHWFDLFPFLPPLSHVGNHAFMIVVIKPSHGPRFFIENQDRMWRV